MDSETVTTARDVDHPAGFFVDRFADCPVEDGLGMRSSHRSPGRIVLELPLLDGVPPAVPLAVAIDSALGLSVQSAPSPPLTGPTLDLRIDQVAAPAPGARSLVVSGEAEEGAGPDTGVGRVRAVDDTGRTVAVAVGTMALQPRPADLPEPWDTLRAVPRFDARRLVDAIAAAPVEEGELPVELWGSLVNLRGSVHGGLVLAIGRLATERLTGGTGRVLSTSAEYLRPLPLVGRVVCRTAAERAGRRFRAFRTEVVLPDGRTGAIVRCSMTTSS